MTKWIVVDVSITDAGGTTEIAFNLPADAARIVAIHTSTDIGANRFPPDAPPYTLPDKAVELNEPTSVVERLFLACIDSPTGAYKKWDTLVCKVCYRYENGQLVEMCKSWENLSQETGIEPPPLQDISPVGADNTPHEEVVASVSFSLRNQLATYPYIPQEQIELLPRDYRKVMISIEAGGDIDRYAARFGQRTQVSTQVGLGILPDAPFMLSKWEFLTGGLQGIQAAPPHTVQLLFFH